MDYIRFYHTLLKVQCNDFSMTTLFKYFMSFFISHKFGAVFSEEKKKKKRTQVEIISENPSIFHDFWQFCFSRPSNKFFKTSPGFPYEHAYKSLPYYSSNLSSLTIMQCLICNYTKLCNYVNWASTGSQLRLWSIVIREWEGFIVL